ncbi:MAG: TonB-dependent receptor [Halioglobus sp.]
MKFQQQKQQHFKKCAMAAAISSLITATTAGTAFAQDGVMEEVVITGIRGSLTKAMDIKREASGVVDSISAEDIGKFPDMNVAESLQRVTGVAIDRSGGEGQQITVRGLGPQFNTVLVNGRQLATDSPGREFNFDVLPAAMITGANIYKSTVVNLQEGGIGATVNLTTARPLNIPGLKVVGEIKGVYETLSEETSPAGYLFVSNTFGEDDNIGVLLTASHTERDVQINRIGTAGWRPGQTISNRNDGVLFTNAYIPRNWDQVVDQQERTRDNINLVLQFAPSDDLSITLDGFVSKFEVDSEWNDLASWFEPDRVGNATIDPGTGTLLNFSQEIDLHQGSGDPATDFVSTTRDSKDVTNDGFGLNVEWDINEKLLATFDVSTSSAENDRAGEDRFNVVGIINNYTFNNGKVAHEGFDNGNLPDANRARLHYNEKGNRFTDEDQIDEAKVDFEYTPDSGVFQSMKFGAYRQEREKSSFQVFGSQCAFCGYGTPAPLDVIGFQPFEADNFFSGLIDQWYTYDGDAMVQFLADSGNPIVTTLQNNRYTINEDITSLYMQFAFEFDLSGMPVTIDLGARYAETDIEVEAIQSFINDVVPTSDLTLFSNVLGEPTTIRQSDSYSNLLPSLNIKLDIQDDMVLRFAAYDSMTRPTMSQLSPATVFNEPRRQNLTATGGNAGLEPFTAENWDISFEWYYGESSVLSFAYFDKEIDNFITTLTGAETYTLSDRSPVDDFRCSTANSELCAEGLALDPTQPDVDVVANTEELNGEQEVYTVSRPRNGDTADVTGYEVAITHIWENGFGIIANATVVDSNVSLSADSTESFALEGLGDSQNLILFYEASNWQARVAFNNREGFLRNIDNGFNGEPINTDTFGQWDISASYDFTDNFTVFFEGINITEEELRQTGRFNNQTYNIEDNGSRFAIGLRGTF